MAIQTYFRKDDTDTRNLYTDYYMLNMTMCVLKHSADKLFKCSI